MSGTRALITVAVIAGVIGLKVWSSVHPREFASGTYSIHSDKAMFSKFSFNRTGKVKAEFAPQGGATFVYDVFLVDEATRSQMDMPGVDLNTLPKLFSSAHITGPVSVPPTSIDSGVYYFIINNPGKDVINVDYKIYEMPN